MEYKLIRSKSIDFINTNGQNRNSLPLETNRIVIIGKEHNRKKGPFSKESVENHDLKAIVYKGVVRTLFSKSIPGVGTYNPQWTLLNSKVLGSVELKERRFASTRKLKKEHSMM